MLLDNSFVTIKIFARTELLKSDKIVLVSFVTIKIFARTELDDEFIFL